MLHKVLHLVLQLDASNENRVVINCGYQCPILVFRQSGDNRFCNSAIVIEMSLNAAANRSDISSERKGSLDVCPEISDRKPSLYPLAEELCASQLLQLQ